ncbi:iron uptake system protein EfeO [Leifsonia sp. Root112D2]|uniref:iron uptake system protein EfeO n=1 Tax=Leifsonia sp. Root112D2 TaxID=1736426 RepID=UPI0006FC310D|nr:iron uptake system protein EfeO [Leifsonia sp. Root112D2]KQV07552.1 PbrT family lead (Pb2+) uptake porter [Leifsonia sp. Root112D2]
MKPRMLSTVTVAALAALALSGCVANSSTNGAASVTVNSSASACTLSAASAPSGTIHFSVSNSSDKVTEFYVLAEDGLRIVGEVENVTPGVKRQLTVQAKPGSYYTVCKPGMVGDGVGKAAFTVTDSGTSVKLAGDLTQQGEAAATNYIAYVKDQSGRLLTATKAFTNAYLAGDDDTARSLYPTARANYERIEPVAESFGDLDPELDFREADVAEGETWTGWHRIEKDLWPPAPAQNSGTTYVALTKAERTSFADKLTVNTQQLYDAVHAKSYSVSLDAISNGAIGLLDEVANGKITGEEEIWSHTDLWDFQANLEGARVAYEGVRDIASSKNPSLVKQIDARFASLEKQLAAYGSLEKGFTFYNDLSTAEVKSLSNGVNALSEPLSQLTAVVVGEG